MADYCRRWYQGFGKRFWEQSEWGRVWGMAVLKAKRRMHGNSIQPHGTRLSLGPCRPRSLSDSRGVQWLAGPSGGPNAAGILAHWQHLDEGREDAAWSESFSDMVMKFLSLLDYVVHGKPLELFFPTQHVTLDVTLGLTKDNNRDKNIHAESLKDHCEQIKFQNDMFGKDLFQCIYHPPSQGNGWWWCEVRSLDHFFAWKMWYVSVKCGIAIGSLVEFFSSTSPFQPLQHTAPDFWMQVDPNFQWGSHDSLLPFPPVMQIKCLFPVEWFAKMIHLYYMILPPQKRNAIFLM